MLFLISAVLRNKEIKVQLIFKDSTKEHYFETFAYVAHLSLRRRLITPISSISKLSSVSPLTMKASDEYSNIFPSVSIVSKPSSGVAEHVILLYLQNSLFLK